MTEWHPIRVVVRRTGLSAHVIRAWERRYGAVEPRRTPTQRRVYSTEDIERLKLLRRATLLGRSIGQVAKRSTAELERLVGEDERAAPVGHDGARAPARPGAPAGDHLNACLSAVRRLDASALKRALDDASVALSRPALVEEVIVPLMHEMGDGWRDGSLRVVHEHLASSVVRSFVGSLRGAFQADASAPDIVVATPAGQLHEFGALLAAATAASEGWRATYLGPSLPAEEIAVAVRQNSARAVALSAIHPVDDPNVLAEIQRISEQLGENTAILIGGRAASIYESELQALGAIVVADYRTFRNSLESLRIPHG